jgi:hypothetical protein
LALSFWSQFCVWSSPSPVLRLRISVCAFHFAGLIFMFALRYSTRLMVSFMGVGCQGRASQCEVKCRNLAMTGGCPRDGWRDSHAVIPPTFAQRTRKSGAPGLSPPIEKSPPKRSLDGAPSRVGSRVGDWAPAAKAGPFVTRCGTPEGVP